MDMIELLKMLAEKQSDAVTQQQIDALQSEVERIAEIQIEALWIIGLTLVGLIVVVAVINELRFRKVERTISRFNSMIQIKADVRTEKKAS